MVGADALNAGATDSAEQTRSF